MRQLTIGALAATALVVGAAGTSDAARQFKAPVNSCVQYRSAVQSDLYENSSSYFRFYSTNTGTAYFSCPITDVNISVWSYLFLDRYDVNDNSTTSYVKATLKKFSDSTGSITNVDTIYSYDSSTTGHLTQKSNFTDTPDFSDYNYAIVGAVSRTNTDDVRAYWVGISSGEFDF